MHYYNDNDEPPQRAEPGRFGSANTQSYSYPFQVLAMVITGFFINQDLLPTGSGFLRVALGLEKSFWVWAWIFIGFMVSSGVISSFASYTYFRITGRAFTQDRIGYARAGAQDISFWIGLVVYLVAIFLFGRYVPAGLLGWARPFVVVIAASIVSSFIGRRVVMQVYSNTLHSWLQLRRYS